MFFKRVTVGVLSVLAAALVWTATPASVGATRPQAVGVLPVATCGTPCGPGASGIGVSAIRSNNPNETAALYRPGGTSQVFWVQTQAVTNGGTQVYDPFTGVAVYSTELVKPVTYNPPNGTVTGEPQGYVLVGPYGSTFYTSAPFGGYYGASGFPYGYPYGPFVAR